MTSAAKWVEHARQRAQWGEVQLEARAWVMAFMCLMCD
jgi:hypothetical protein